MEITIITETPQLTVVELDLEVLRGSLHHDPESKKDVIIVASRLGREAQQAVVLALQICWNALPPAYRLFENSLKI